MSTRSLNAVKFRQLAQPGRQPGERARLKVIQGPDYGTTFVVTAERSSIGRGDENDVVLSDLKASRLHAEIRFQPNGWEIRDLGSANGISVNGDWIRHALLRSGSVFGVGETQFEFFESTSQGTRVLTAPTVDPGNAQARVIQIKQANDKRVSQVKQQTASNPMKVIVPVVLIIGVIFLLPEEKKRKWVPGYVPKTNLNPNANRVETPAAAPSSESKDAPAEASAMDSNRSAETFMRAGLREYREKNYLRAIQNFENALQIVPNHGAAIRYRKNSLIAIEDEVRRHLESGKRSMSVGRYKDARGHFEAILRLRSSDPTDPSAVESKERLEQIAIKTQARETQ